MGHESYRRRGAYSRRQAAGRTCDVLVPSQVHALFNAVNTVWNSAEVALALSLLRSVEDGVVRSDQREHPARQRVRQSFACRKRYRKNDMV